MVISDDVDKQFLLPIEYISYKNSLEDSTKLDLELNKTTDMSGLYWYVFKPSTSFGEIVTKKYSNFYTSDIEFLKDSQNIINDVSFNLQTLDTNNELYNLWNNIKTDEDFIDKYQYVDINMLKFLNNNSKFLQFLSVFNLSSPVISLLFPVFMLILPFFLIKLNNTKVTFSEYYKFLKIVIMRNSLGALIFNFGSVSLDKKLYLCLSAGLYIFQIYQNIIMCRRFYLNIQKIHIQLFLFRDHIENTIQNIDNHLLVSNKYKSYNDFNSSLIKNRPILEEFLFKLKKITPYKIDTKKLCNIGYLMKCYYSLFDDKRYNDSLLFSFGFAGYIEIITNLKRNILLKNVNKCTIKSKVDTKCKFTNAYYPPLLDSKTEIVKNTYKLDKNKIITGPNASGKTTLLKTTLFNIILSQQLGYGFYDNAIINPYDILHCYLNIPDTSGRDSLFQAESRRCKNILDILEKNKTKRHFCIFDELYSGTNPYEAISGAYAYLSYLSNFKNFNFILTTHYVELCEKIKSNKSIVNNHMKINFHNDKENENNSKQIISTNNEFIYTYKLVPDISTVKGGTKVFRDLEYPDVIISTMLKNL